ncbi:MAG: phytoene synthase [Gammaproteobacteria bacterium]|jgi:phytoene synthase
MDPFQYCNDKAAMPGTPGYYAVLFQPPPVRNALVALRALQCELDDVVEQCSDRDVALRKLDYWQKELLNDNSAQPHPVSLALRESGGALLNRDARAGLLAATVQRISQPQFHTEDEIDELSAASAGVIAQACARLANRESSQQENPAAAVKMAVASERLRLLSLPRRAGLPAHSSIALSTLTACALTPTLVDRGGDDQTLVALRQSLLDRLSNSLAEADRLIESRQGHLATCWRLTRCLVAANQRNGYVRSGRLCRVAPLKLLWHAWRANG